VTLKLAERPENDTEIIDVAGMYLLTYAEVREAMQKLGIEHYSMSLASDQEKMVLVMAVNQGIDSHLQICNCPERGDSFVCGKRTITATSDTKWWKAGDELIMARTLDCEVSAESLPVLLRRLYELDTECPEDWPEGDSEDPNDAGWSLAGGIISSLGFHEIDGTWSMPE
jgi:hypothetical protein